MAGYLEKIADLLPQNRREEWLRLATPHKAVFQDDDELMLMLWTLALIGDDMSEKSALVIDGIERWEGEREGLAKERIAELVKNIAQGIEDKAPSFKDLKTVTHELRTTARSLGKGETPNATISTPLVFTMIIMAGVFSGLATFGVLWIKELNRDQVERLQSSIPAVENFFAIVHARGGEVEAKDDQLIIKGASVEIAQGEKQITVRFK